MSTLLKSHVLFKIELSIKAKTCFITLILIVQIADFEIYLKPHHLCGFALVKTQDVIKKIKCGGSCRHAHFFPPILKTKAVILRKNNSF